MDLGHAGDVFLRKLKEFEGLLRFAAQRYSINGVVEPDDLYQEGCVLLDTMIRNGVFEPDSEDFRKMFKTRLWHELWRFPRAAKSQKRDYRKNLSFDVSPTLQDLMTEQVDCTQSDPGTFDPEKALGTETTSPEITVLVHEESVRTSKFLDELRSRLDADACRVFQELVSPRTWEDIPQQYRETVWGDGYFRLPRRIPHRVLADTFDWPMSRFRHALRRIRRVAKELAVELEFDCVEEFMQRRERRAKS